MKWKISSQFLVNYAIMFVITTFIGIFVFILTGFANKIIADTLVKNNYTAESLMQDDYNAIDIDHVLSNGGGVQVINRDYEVVYTAGLNTLTKNKFTVKEFTDFLTSSKSLGIPFSYSIDYNSGENFWLIVTFPTSLRIDFAMVQNKDYASVDTPGVIGAFALILILYLLLITIITLIYSKITSIGIVKSLRKLNLSALRLRDGDYTARVELNINNEFSELQDTFNNMASRIEEEISLRKQAETNRKKIILDISHDLKNPLASIMGYAQHCKNNSDLSKNELELCLKIIYDNSVRANSLITNLFELSKMESTEFKLYLTSVDVCEYLREEISKAIPVLDNAGFLYDFNIPEEEIYAMLDVGQMSRAFQNLTANSVQYNSEGTEITINLYKQHEEIIIIFKDDGVGIPKDIAKDIFQPFVRADASRNSQTGGTGLGLAIVEKIIIAHRGTIILNTDINKGCEFIISLPKI